MCGNKVISVLLIAVFVATGVEGDALGITEWRNENGREVLTGEFNMTSGMRLDFRSIVGEDTIQLLIADAEGGDVIISYIVSKLSPIGYLQVGEFVFVENIVSNEAYYLRNKKAIPAELNTYRDEDVYLTSSQQQQQQQQNVTKEFVLSKMHTRYDLEMLGNLSRSIGVDAGVKGWGSASAMAIFLASQAFSPHHTHSALNRTARDTGGQFCPNKESRSCVKKPIGRSCLGMCGPGDCCWEWVCGDCCYHIGCYEHDECCRKHGLISWECLSVWKFSCEHYDCS